MTAMAAIYSWISNQNDLSCFDLLVTPMLSRQLAFRFRRRRRFLLFWIYKSPWCFLPSFKSIGLSVQEKRRKIDFQDGRNGRHPWFQIRTILAIFDVQVTLMLPTMFQVNWHFGSGAEAKNRFWRWPPYILAAILDFRRWPPYILAPILDFRSERI